MLQVNQTMILHSTLKQQSYGTTKKSTNESCTRSMQRHKRHRASLHFASNFMQELLKVWLPPGLLKITDMKLASVTAASNLLNKVLGR